MQRRLLALAAGILLAGCAAGAARESPPTPPAEPWIGPPRVYALIGQRDRLSLASEQVERLDSIGMALAEENRPLAARVNEIRGDPARPRRLSSGAHERVTDLIEEIRQNNLEAQRRVQETLTREQRDRVCQLYAQDIREQQQRDDRARLRERQQRIRRDPMRGDTLPAMRNEGWIWCHPGLNVDSVAPADPAA